MMRNIFLGFLMMFGMVLFSSFLLGEKEHDAQLVGVWKGFEKDQETEGVEKHWILHRYDDGKYVIMFTVKDGCEVETFFENGEWWTKDGKFYEKSKESKFTDQYSYEIKDKTVVKYKSLELNGAKKTDYNFSDFKLDLN